MYRLSTKNYNPRATGSLRHLMLKVLARHTLTAPYRLSYSTYFLLSEYGFTILDLFTSVWRVDIK